jgi:hypothetical protein
VASPGNRQVALCFLHYSRTNGHPIYPRVAAFIMTASRPTNVRAQRWSKPNETRN